MPRFATARDANGSAIVTLNGLPEPFGQRPVFECFVPGIPRPQGSKSRGKGGRMYEASKHLKAWRADVTAYARSEWVYAQSPVRKPLTGPLVFGVQFVFPRPQKHYLWTTSHGVRMRQGLRADAPVYVTCKPDVSKLLRAVEDSLTVAGVWGDDSLVVGYAGFPLTCKRYANPGEEPGALIRVWRVS